MEYKINNFNLSDINFADLKSLAEYFEKAIPKQKINNLFLGPNLLNLSYAVNEKQKKTPEDKKLLSSLSRLIITSQMHKPDQSVLVTINSYTSTKLFLSRLLKQLGLLSLGTTNDKTKMDQVATDIRLSISLLDFISFFTCIKLSGGDDIPITDYDLTFTNDSSLGIPGIKLTGINCRIFNYEMIAMKTEPKTQLMNMSNVNFLYMLLYNLPLKDLFTYLYCDCTKEYFNIFDEEIELQDYVRRYVLINQLKLTKTESQYEVFAKENDSYIKIKKEYDYYYNLYIQYQKIKADLMLTDQFEQRLIGIYLGMILIAEFDIINDPLITMITKELKASYSNSSIDLFTFIRNIVLNDERFKYIQTKDQTKSRMDSESILSKIALNTSISEERILYLLVTDLVKKGKGKINLSKDSIEANCQQLIVILYQLSIDRIKAYMDSNVINKGKKAVSFSPHIRKVQFIISRSNLVYEYSFKQYAFKTCPYYSINSSDMKSFDDKTYIISQNVRELIVSNYLQELKNFIYITQSMGITSNSKELNWPKISYNDEYVSQLLDETYHHDSIINLYENQQCGLIKMVIDMSYDDSSNSSSSNSNSNANKEEQNLNVFKAHLDSLFVLGKKKSIVQFVEVFNTETQLYQTFIQAKHSFGTFLYDLNAIFSNKHRISTTKEQTIYKFIDCKPLYTENYFRYNEDASHKLLKKLSMSNLFICNVIRFSNDYSTMIILDDFKLNSLYFFYSNFFNYIINVKELKESIIKSKAMQLTHSMIRDDMILFKFICKKLRFSIRDYYYNNGYIFAKTKLSRAMDNNKNISAIIFKYNPQLFNFLLVKKITSSKFKYFVFIVNSIKTFVKLTKIYNEKKVLSNVRNLLTDVIVDNYEILDNENKKLKHSQEAPCNINQINQNFLPKIDQLSELVFDFNKEALSKILPKLRSNLTKLKRIWKDYVSDIKYLEVNKHNFYNKRSTQIVIEQRLINFQILLFLFSKKYKFINSDCIKKYGVLLTEFTKTVSNEVLTLLSDLDREFHLFLEDNDLNIIENTDNSKLEGLIAKRIELQKAMKHQSQMNNSNSNSLREDKKRNEKENMAYDDAFNKAMSNIQEHHNSNTNGHEYDLKNNLSFKDLKNQTNSKDDSLANEQKTSSERASREKGGGISTTNKPEDNANNHQGKYGRFIKDIGFNQQQINSIPSNDLNSDVMIMIDSQKKDGIHKDNSSQKNNRNIIVDFKEELINANIQKAEEERIGRNKLKALEEEKRSEAVITGSDSLSKISGYNEKSKELPSTSSNNNNIDPYNPNAKNSSDKIISEETEDNPKGVSDNAPSNLNINKMINSKLKANQSNQRKIINADLFMQMNSNDSKRSLGNNYNKRMLPKDNQGESIKEKESELNCGVNDEEKKELRDKEEEKGNNPFLQDVIEDDTSIASQNKPEKDKKPSMKGSPKKPIPAEDKSKEESQSQQLLVHETPKKASKKDTPQKDDPKSNSSMKKTEPKDLSNKEEFERINNDNYSNKKQRLSKRRIDFESDPDNQFEGEEYNPEEEDEDEEMYYSPEKDNQDNELYQYQDQGEGDGDEKEIVDSTLKHSQKTYQLGTEDKIAIMHSYTNPYIDMNDKPLSEYPTYTPDTQIISSVPLQIPLPKEKIDDIIQSLTKESSQPPALKIDPHPKPKKKEEEEEEEKQLAQPPQTFSLPALKELDDKISQLKKELNALEVMGKITDNTSLFCFTNDDNRESELLKEEAEKIDKEFYDDIEEKLKLAEKAIRSQFA